MPSDTRLNNGIAESDFDEWVGCDKSLQYTIHVTELGKQNILHSQVVVNRIEMIIRDKENDLEYMEKLYPNIDSKSHNLHHSWVAKLDNIDMFKGLLL